MMIYNVEHKEEFYGRSTPQFLRSLDKASTKILTDISVVFINIIRVVCMICIYNRGKRRILMKSRKPQVHVNRCTPPAEHTSGLILTDIVDDSLQDQQRVNDDIHLTIE